MGQFEIRNVDGVDYYMLTSFAENFWFVTAVGDPLALVKIIKAP
jgi:hypothetical protein